MESNDFSDYEFSNRHESDKSISGIILSKQSGEIIGTYEMHVYDETFLSAINIMTDYKNMGIGFKAFEFCFKGLSVLNTLKFFQANWYVHKEYSHLINSSSTNLTAYLQQITAGVETNTALWNTPTGKWLKRLGFRNVQLIRESDEYVQAIFS